MPSQKYRVRENAGINCHRPFIIPANRGTTNKKMNRVAVVPITIKEHRID